jgi:hypothetical protein
MTTFFRLIGHEEKASGLLESVEAIRSKQFRAHIFKVDPESFKKIPGSPFAYWITKGIIEAFSSFPAFSSGRTLACKTNPAGDDFRFIRLWWEVRNSLKRNLTWVPLAKGGNLSAFYYDIHLVVSWNSEKKTYLGYIGTEHRPLERPASVNHFFRPGLTWPSRTQVFGPRAMPAGSIFTGKAPAAFDFEDDPQYLLANCAIMNSSPFKALVATRLNAADATARSFEVGIIQETPAPRLEELDRTELADLAHKIWSIRYHIDTNSETSHAFVLPNALRGLDYNINLKKESEEVERLELSIDKICFSLYRFDDLDQQAVTGNSGVTLGDAAPDVDESETDENLIEDSEDALLSWCVGVAFGRFDWRLATPEGLPPSDPSPFDPLPAKSPGMLPDGAEAFHTHPGILVDDPGHPHDLARLVEEVAERVGATVPHDVRRRVRRDFFPLHLQRYSKSRRKAPIYWPLGIPTGDYTVWIYYPSLNDETLYVAANEFIEPKIKDILAAQQHLRSKQSRGQDDARQLERLEEQEAELKMLRDALLRIAPAYKPNHDDGVQITAAPLWSLFRHRPWQDLLKETWLKLEGGEYDWASLAFAYWPDRVRRNCRTDRSLAITHGLEELYVPPDEGEAQPRRGRKGRGAT